VHGSRLSDQPNHCPAQKDDDQNSLKRLGPAVSQGYGQQDEKRPGVGGQMLYIAVQKRCGQYARQTVSMPRQYAKNPKIDWQHKVKQEHQPQDNDCCNCKLYISTYFHRIQI
jgi:hypothetical protein